MLAEMKKNQDPVLEKLTVWGGGGGELFKFITEAIVT